MGERRAPECQPFKFIQNIIHPPVLQFVFLKNIVASLAHKCVARLPFFYRFNTIFLIHIVVIRLIKMLKCSNKKNTNHNFNNEGCRKEETY